MGAKSYKDLIVWQKAMDLVVETYRLTEFLPKDELYNLTNLLRRAVVSVPSNIAEGNSRDSVKNYIYFLGIAQGSKSEVETLLDICVRLGYLAIEQIKTASDLSDEIGKMLNTMIKKIGIRD